MVSNAAGGCSRRELFALTGGAITAGVIAGCGHKSVRPRVRRIPPPARKGDLAVLIRALQLEHQAITAYTAGIPLLRGRPQAAAKHFLDQEISHAGELAGLIKQAGGKPSRVHYRYELGHPRTAGEVLQVLHQAEQAQLAWYLGTLPSVAPGPVRAALAAVLSSDAQHLSLLRSALRLRPTTAAFVSAQQ